MREGLYESLLTENLRRRLAEDPALLPQLEVVDEARQPHVLGAHLAQAVHEAPLQTRGTERRIAFVDRLLGVLAEFGMDADQLGSDETDTDRVRQLLALAAADPVAGPRQMRRPATPLAEAALLTNAKGEPTLAAELRAELDSADGVDLLCAFITWNGVRLLDQQLTQLRQRGVPLRVITTTYLGATERKALDALACDHGVQVRVTYEIERTRLHAKAWLLRRGTGFDTAYVGSGNLRLLLGGQGVRALPARGRRGEVADSAGRGRRPPLAGPGHGDLVRAGGGTDLSGMAWSHGAYDQTALEGLYTGNDARLRVVLRQVRDKVTDVGRMRALGYCVSTAHARWMAARFTDAGIPALAVWADTPHQEREQALEALRRREINALFAVDLFYEGLDIPQIDTVLFLRPTESVTVFLQQLGRGLRPLPDKSVLTALDFVGHQRKEFRFDQRFAALTGLSRRQLERQVADGFPFLPSGCQIVLDPVAQEVVLASVREQVAPRWTALRDELRRFSGDRLAAFLDDSGRDLADVLRGRGRSWTALCRDAGKSLPPAGPFETTLADRARTVAHVDDAVRMHGYRRLLTDQPHEPPEDAAGHRGTGSVLERRLAAMLFFSLYPDGGSFPHIDAGLRTLRQEPALRDELTQLIDLSYDRTRRPLANLADVEPALREVPLAVHASYSREEILAALDHASMKRRPSTMREGVAWCDAVQADAFFITLQKSERDFSPTTMYRDYALTPELFHGESQSTTSVVSPTGQRYLHHAERGSHILLFVRATAKGPLGTAPYVFLGPANYISHTGDRPIAITWKLRTPMPTETFLLARAAVA